MLPSLHSNIEQAVYVADIGGTAQCEEKLDWDQTSILGLSYASALGYWFRHVELCSPPLYWIQLHQERPKEKCYADCSLGLVKTVGPNIFWTTFFRLQES